MAAKKERAQHERTKSRQQEAEAAPSDRTPGGAGTGTTTTARPAAETTRDGGSGDLPESSGDASPGYDTAASRFVERFAAELTEAGMQRMAARVFACLLVSESGALSSAELGERLRVSPAAVSGAVRMLAGVHIVSREREPGSRRELYRLHSDIWYQTISERDAFVMRWIGTFQEGAQALGPQTPAGRRLLESVEFFRFLEQELRNIMERWQAHREALRHPDSGAGSDSGSGDSGSGPSDSGARSDSGAGAGG